MSITDDFKNALCSWASGVSVVTTRAGGRVEGLTVSCFASLSLDPPLVLVCLAGENRMNGMINDAQAFAVSILSADQEAASAHFATSDREPVQEFTEVETETTDSGLPVIKNALAFLSCELHSVLEGGDHNIICGKVVQAVSRPGDPLLYFSRGYRKLT